VPRESGGMCSRQGLLTRFVFLPLRGDSQGVHIESQIPRHGLQQHHGEGPVRVSVVDESADLSGLQPVSAHVALSVQYGCWQFRCEREKDRGVGGNAR